MSGMLAEPAVLALSLAYLGLLFAVAWFGDRHARTWSTSSVAPAVYGLSLAIYCTSWTFYGAVGRAATAGLDFILIYTGPVLGVTAGYPPVAKIGRAAKQHHVTPDTSLIVAALMALFTILFGVRNVQASEQHRGMMLAIAYESAVKLLALLTVGPFVLFVLFDGPSDLWARLSDQAALASQVTREGSPLTWIVTSLLSAMAFLCLPRQFHVAVVEHGHPASLRTARWLFPSYLLLITLSVLPTPAGGLLLIGSKVSPDLYVLQLPLSHGEGWLSAFVFIGGLSAATSMVIVACMALSGMIGNELLMPHLLRRRVAGPPGIGPLVAPRGGARG